MTGTKTSLTWFCAGLCSMMLQCTPLCAQNIASVRRDSTTVHSTMFGWGKVNLLDSYLSRQTFRGHELHLLYQSVRPLKKKLVERYIEDHASVAWAGTHAYPHSVLSGMFRFKIGWYYQCPIRSRHFSVNIGGLSDVLLGVTYNTRNSNNPVQLRASLHMAPSASCSYQTKCWNRPVSIDYRLTVPVVGMAFAPAYGQSYYEIFSQGDYDHNLVLTSPFSGFQLAQMLKLNVRLKHTTLSLGYMNDIRQMKANSIKYHNYSHAFMIGWSY